MRPIDADALPRCWQPDCNGNRQFVDTKDIDDAPTVCCADPRYRRALEAIASDDDQQPAHRMRMLAKRALEGAE